MDIFTTAKGWMQTVYGSIVGITLVAGGCCAAVCLFLIIFSKNQKTVDSSVQWIKRIIIAVIGILAMSTIIRYIPDKLGLSESATI